MSSATETLKTIVECTDGACISSFGAEEEIKACLCLIRTKVSDWPQPWAPYHLVLKHLKPYYYHTLRYQMKRCRYHQFIQRSLLISQSHNSSDTTRNNSVGSSDAMILILTNPIQVPLSFSSILFLPMCFHEYFELFSVQGTWVCILSWLLVHGQATSAWTPVNANIPQIRFGYVSNRILKKWIHIDLDTHIWYI
jgi:hypothetical protein